MHFDHQIQARDRRNGLGTWLTLGVDSNDGKKFTVNNQGKSLETIGELVVVAIAALLALASSSSSSLCIPCLLS